VVLILHPCDAIHKSVKETADIALLFKILGYKLDMCRGTYLWKTSADLSSLFFQSCVSDWRFCFVM